MYMLEPAMSRKGNNYSLFRFTLKVKDEAVLVVKRKTCINKIYMIRKPARFTTL